MEICLSSYSTISLMLVNWSWLQQSKAFNFTYLISILMSDYKNDNIEQVQKKKLND